MDKIKNILMILMAIVVIPLTINLIIANDRIAALEANKADKIAVECTEISIRSHYDYLNKIDSVLYEHQKVLKCIINNDKEYITKEEYDRWRYRYPELDTSGQWHKITPSQELSDLLLADLKEHSEE